MPQRLIPGAPRVIGLGLTLTSMIVLLLYLVGRYKGLMGLRKNIDVAWANIDVLFKQRNDELPKLTETCKCYMQFDQEPVDKVIRASISVSNASASDDVATVGTAERKLRSCLTRLFAVAERYSELKADENFKTMRTWIIALEDAIAERREFYNDQVNLNNIRVRVLPDVLIARHFGFRAAPLLDYTADEKWDIDVGALVSRIAFRAEHFPPS